MQADVFKDLCTSIWEHDDAGNMPHHSREIAKLLNPKSIREVPEMGAFAVLFPDMSVAMCGQRGSSVIDTFSFYDHADEPLSHEKNTYLVLNMADFGWFELSEFANTISRYINEIAPDQGNVTSDYHKTLADYFRTLCAHIEDELPEGQEISDHVVEPGSGFLA